MSATSTCTATVKGHSFATGSQAGHWPLPTHVAEMIQWLDSVSTLDARSATDIAAAALLREKPDLVTAVRVAGEARSLMKKYKGEDASEVKARLDLVEQALDGIAAGVWSRLEPMVAENEGGKTPGAYAADVRWARRELGEAASFASLLGPLKSAMKKHDKALERLAKTRARGDEGKKYAKSPVAALEDSWLSPDWDRNLATELRRVDGGWEPIEDLGVTLRSFLMTHGTEPSPELLSFVAASAAEFKEANSALRSD